MDGKKTDLAVEIKESIKSDHTEVAGVVLRKKKISKNQGEISWVEIINKEGSRVMNKPEGIYVTLESKCFLENECEAMLEAGCDELMSIIQRKNSCSFLVVGIGNREVTSDSLGPKTIDKLMITRQFECEWGQQYMIDNGLVSVSAIAPGVMGQTGMDPYEIVQGLVKSIKPDYVVVIDALLARSIERLCTTIQITDTGISPGAGVGNPRQELTEKTLGVPVIAIGVPTVVEAETILYDYMEEALLKQDLTQEETDKFLKEILFEPNEPVMVTPKNIDELIDKISACLAEVLNRCFQKMDK